MLIRTELDFRAKSRFVEAFEVTSFYLSQTWMKLKWQLGINCQIDPQKNYNRNISCGSRILELNTTRKGHYQGKVIYRK